MELLESLFRQPHRGGDGQRSGFQKSRGPQWQSRHCNGLPNDQSRACCRGCGAARPAGVRPSGPDGRSAPRAPDVAPGAPGSAAAPSGAAVTAVPPRAWPPRPPAPEERAAAAAGKAAALDCAADVLRQAGLEAEANALKKPAARLAKDARGVKPGARLDACAAFVERAERRLAAARADVEAAEAALVAAQARVSELNAELAEGRRRLDDL